MSEGMIGVLLALTRSFGTLTRGRAWAYIVGPSAVALVIWLPVAFYWLGDLISWTILLPPFSWFVAWDWTGFARFSAGIAVWLAVLTLVYVTATLLAATIVLPMLLNWLAENEYRDVGRMGRDSQVASVVNSLWAVLLCLGGWVLTLPLWLIPGVGLMLSVYWLAWLNRRTFAFDALIAHATDAESRSIRQGQAQPLLFLGLFLSLLAHIPVLGLVVPTFSALAYVHFSLEALRRIRQGAVVTATAVVVEDDRMDEEAR